MDTPALTAIERILDFANPCSANSTRAAFKILSSISFFSVCMVHYLLVNFVQYYMEFMVLKCYTNRVVDAGNGDARPGTTKTRVVIEQIRLLDFSVGFSVRQIDTGPKF